MGKELQNLTRNIKEATHRRVNDPSLIRSIGKYQLQHIWDEALFNIHKLNLKYDTPFNSTFYFPVTSAYWRKTMVNIQVLVFMSLVVDAQSITMGRQF